MRRGVSSTLCARVSRGLVLAAWLGLASPGHGAPPAAALAAELDRLSYLAERRPDEAAPLAQALRQRGEPLAPAQQVQLALAEGSVALAQARTSDVLERAQQALQGATGLGDAKSMAEALVLRANARAMAGEDALAVTDMLLALQRAEEVPGATLAVVIRGQLILLYAERANFEQAFFHLGQAEWWLSVHPDAEPLVRARVADARAFLAQRLGDLDGANKFLALARDLFMQADHRLGANDATRLMGNALRDQERWGEALPLLDAALAAARTQQDGFGIGMGQSARSVVLAALGRRAEALEASAAAWAAMASTEYGDARLVVMIDRINMLSRLGRVQPALELIAETRPLARQQSDIAVQLRMHGTLADAYERMGRHREALGALRDLGQVKERRDRERVEQQLAGLRGQLQSARLISDNELLRREADTARQLQQAEQRAVQFRTALAAVLAALGLVLLGLLWRFVRRSRRLGKLVSSDALTGALSRRGIEGVGSAAFQGFRSQGGELCVLMLDLDHFKRVNDVHGHPAGDRTLVAVVTEMRRHLRAGDHIGRYGGEEFVVVLAHTPPATARQVGERLRESVKSLPAGPQGLAAPVTISLGLAWASAGDADFAALMARADQAMYLSKRAGRDRLTELGAGAAAAVA